MSTRPGGPRMVGMQGSSPRAVDLSTTKLAELVDAGALSIRDAIGTGRANATGTQCDEYVRNLAKDFNRDRSKADKQIAAFVVDIAIRGTLEDALEIPYRLAELARMAYEAAHPQPEPTFAELHLAEENAEGEAESAELTLVHFPGLAADEAYLRKSTAHTERRAAMDRAVRRRAILARKRAPGMVS